MAKIKGDAIERADGACGSANGTTFPTVQWEVSTDAGASWSAISGATSASYSIAEAPLSLSGMGFRVIAQNVVSNVTNSATSSVATLTVNAGALDHFAISTVSSPQTAGTPFTIGTITAQDVNNNTVTSFGGTVTFGGTAGVTGSSGIFSSGVLSSATPRATACCTPTAPAPAP